MTFSQNKKVVDKSHAKYPFLTVNLFRGRGDELLNRSETKGGANLRRLSLKLSRAGPIVALPSRVLSDDGFNERIFTIIRSPSIVATSKRSAEHE
jgi:hypothetical protein